MKTPKEYANKQPKPKNGFEFTGWATFNWGICHQRVFRTRKQAQESCCENGETWNDVKDHFSVVKVRCFVEY